MSESKTVSSRKNPSRRAKRKRDAKLHLDALSDKALQHVLRKMSNQPRGIDWRRCFNTEDALCWVRMGRRFADAVRKNFLALEISPLQVRNFRAVDIAELADAYTAPLSVYMSRRSCLKLACGLLTGLGATLLTLRIDLDKVPWRLSSSIATSFAKSCKSVRHLFMFLDKDCPHFPALLKTFGPTSSTRISPLLEHIARILNI